MTTSCAHQYIWTIWRRDGVRVRDAHVCRVCGDEQPTGTTPPEQTYRSARFVDDDDQQPTPRS